MAAFLLLWSAVAWGQGAYKTEPVGPLNSPDVPKALEEKLQTRGTRLVSDKGAAVSEVWLVKSAASGPSSGGSDAIYSNLTVGTLVAVIHFPAPWLDFPGCPKTAITWALTLTRISWR
ncbi:MAG: hypothetical protein DMG25_16155 [Acidobacteria bacterium]|nr:MAG: hypothetical protein DMG25_16155 [Acidobacteriota bacterium]